MQTTIPTLGPISWGRRLMPATTALGLLLVLGFAQSGFAQNASTQNNLKFGNNFFVTGDYAVGGVSLIGKASGGFATGTISIGGDTNPGVAGTNSVPQGAQIVAALLYWETIEIVGGATGQNGFFRPVFNGGPSTGYAIKGTILANPNPPVYWGNGGCASTSATSKQLVAYRADVRAYLQQDASGNVIGNGSYEVRLASQGGGSPLTMGATLVIIYRVLSPDFPLNSIVIYDGTFAPTNTSLTTMQTIQGFYDAAASPKYKLTYVVGNGQKNLSETVSLNNFPLTSLYTNQPPFPGSYQGGLWDNPTWIFPNPNYPNLVTAGASSVSTVVNDTKQGCVAPAAIIFSTKVQNIDNDGLLDVWKAPPPPNSNTPGYCDASINEGVCNGPGDPAWVDLTGAVLGQKDVFVQLDYTCSKVTGSPVTGPGSCDTTNPNYSFDPRLTVDPADGMDAIQKVTAAFASNKNHAPVNLHVNYTHAIQEQACTDMQGQLCPFPNQPGVVGWPGGFIFYENQLVDPSNGNLCLTSPVPPTCVPVFQHGKKDSVHHAFFAHALGLPSWTLQAGTLTSVTQSGNTVTFKTSTPHGLGGNANDTSCANGRVTVAYAITNLNLNGTFCVMVTGQTTFTINIGGNATNATYTRFTDPNLAVASGQAGTISGFSDIGGSHSLITLGSWGPDGQTWQAKAGTFMHELGHADGLTHSGFYYGTSGSYVPTVEANCKSNFQSVMNYMFQVDLLDTSGLTNVPDYSGQALTALNESATTSNPLVSPSPTYLSTSWYVPTVVGTPATQHCDGTPLLNTDQPMSRVTDLTTSLSWSTGQDINFNGKIDTSLRGHDDWTSDPMSPGADYRQISATGTLSAPGLGGTLGGGGGLGGTLGGGGGLGGTLGGGGGLGGTLGGGGGVGELTRATANSVTRPPRNLTASEGVSPRTITLNWTAPTFGQIGAYRIYRAVKGATPPLPLLATVPGTQLTFPDTVTCNSTGYQYYVTAVLAGTFQMFPPGPTEGQESVNSNIVSTGQNGQLLTGCYGPTGFQFSSPANAVHGSIVSIAWTVQDASNKAGFAVPISAVNTLVVNGPLPNSCATVGDTTILANGILTAQSGALSTFSQPSPGQYMFNLDTDGFCAGQYTVKLILDNQLPLSSHQMATASLQLQIDVTDTDSTPHITTTSLPNGVVGTFYSNTISEDGGVTGGPHPFAWTLASGSNPLPPGISLGTAPDGVSGLLSGTPCAPGTYTFMVKVTDSVGNFGMQTLMLRVLAAPVAQVNQPLVPESSVPGAAGFTLTVNGTGFVPSCSAVLWNGSARATTFTSAKQLTATILAADVAAFGTASISVANTGSPNSNVDFFQITNPTTSVSLSRTDFTSGVNPLRLIAADFNGDGKSDLAIPNGGSNTVSILLGNGNGTFQSHVDFSTGPLPYAIAAGDFNGDGKLDLAVANFNNGMPSAVSILLGNGDGTFQPHVDYTVGNGPISVVTGDFNGDGKLDLAVANQNDHTVSILVGNGDGTFQPRVDYAAAAGTGTLDAADVVLGDFNRDGKLDLAVPNPSSNTVSILLGNGDGTFQAPVGYTTGNHPVSVTAADLNGDGKLDLAITNLNDNTVSILLGNGNGTFQTKMDYSTTTSPFTGPAGVITGDFNGDGNLDLAITNQNANTVSILLGNGSGTFQAPLEFTTGTFPFGVATGDFNADGRLDMAVGNHGSGTVSVMLQPQVLLVPSVLAFGNVSVTTPTSNTSVVGLTNNGPAALTIFTIAFGGSNPSDFSQSNNCPVSPATLAAGGSCTISVTFTPTQTGTRSATLMITDTATDSPQMVNIAGTGTP